MGIALVFAGVLLVLSLLGRMELTAVNEALSECAQEVERLEEENTKLHIAYRSLIDLEAIEKQATEVYGMIQPAGGSLPGAEDRPDRVTVFQPERDAAEIWESGVAMLGEFFS